MTTIGHRRDPVKTIDRPASVPFMVTVTAGKVQGTYKKGGIITIDGERFKIMSIHSIEIIGKTIKVVGKAFPFERIAK